MNAQVDNKSKTEERAASGLCAAEGTGARTDARTWSRLENQEVPQHGRAATLGQELCFGYS